MDLSRSELVTRQAPAPWWLAKALLRKGFALATMVSMDLIL